MLINGIELNLEEHGAGTPLVLVHGLGANLRVWDAEVAHFSPGFRVITYDARGHGKSTRPASFALDDHVADLRALVEILGDKPVALLGASMGSYIVQGLASHFPSLVAKLVLVVPKCHGTTSSSARLLAAHADDISHLSHRDRQIFLLNKAFAPQTPASVREQVIATELSCFLDERAMHAASNALAGFDFRDDLPRVTAQSLVICGSHDALNPPEEGRACAQRIPHCEYVELPQAGHFPGAEASQAYFAALDAFLGRAARP
ncbi:alpha/beta fold hydrolase [Cupriavidus pauculus]|uniref:Alpha/beta hydrolase n=1 Tax=Cupriavidus pauculus TaxID=82633 RepID=A0A2N5C5L1_9BURK|nr:alpha/beta fold hydrolase [Cupriavidus pauculus]PLP97515.1 alpha/beta hydrolase [Cupriavidus pauculus]